MNNNIVATSTVSFKPAKEPPRLSRARHRAILSDKRKMQEKSYRLKLKRIRAEIPTIESNQARIKHERKMK